jgi:hypothetical protein
MGKGVHERVGLEVQVMKHIIKAPPMANKSDDVGIDAGPQESHGATGPKAAGRDTNGADTKLKI